MSQSRAVPEDRPTLPVPDRVEVARVATVDLAASETRTEHDLLGEAEVPRDAFWGIHTMRAVANFPITGIPVGHFPEFVRALVLVKQAAARANKRLGHLHPAKADAIDAACARIADSRELHAQFVVDAVQGGAGTSTDPAP